MKIRFAAAAGAASLNLLLLAGIGMSGGCSSPQVLRERQFLPAPSEMEEVEVTETIEQEEIKVDLKETPEVTPVTVPDLPPLEPIKVEAITYTVQKGDSLWKIARKYGVSVPELAAHNGISPKKTLMVGKVLRIPPGGQLLSPDQLKKIKARKPAKRKFIKKRTVTRKKRVSRAALPSDGLYTVKSGDSLWVIARRFGVSSSALAKANNLSKSSVLRIGQRLVIPGKSVKEVSAAPVETAAPAAQPEKQPDADALLKSIEPEKKQKDEADEILKAIPQEDSGKSLESLTKELDLDTVKTKSVEVTEDTTVEKFAAKNGVKAEEIRKLNPEIEADGKLNKGDIVTIPE